MKRTTTDFLVNNPKENQQLNLKRMTPQQR